MNELLRRGMRFAKKSPFAAGVPFMGMVVLASYGFSFLTQTKYDKIDARYHMLDKREELGLKRDQEPADIRKIYFDLAKNSDEDWDFVRVPRPPGSGQE